MLMLREVAEAINNPAKLHEINEQSSRISLDSIEVSTGKSIREGFDYYANTVPLEMQLLQNDVSTLKHEQQTEIQ